MSYKFFMYGTLKPGHERWPVVEPFVLRVQEAVVAGELYSLAYYPAARFHEDSENIIPGFLVHTVADERITKNVDAVEGHPTLFKRTVINAIVEDDGVLYSEAAYAYEYVHAEHLYETARIDAWHPERDRIHI